MKIAVIGGSGFIGTCLVDILTDNDHQVIIIDKNPSAKYPDLVENVDIRDGEKLIASLNNFDWVYHLAAEHRDDVDPIQLYYDVNVDGTANLIRAMEKNYINNIIFTSSVAVYGLSRDEPGENDPVKPDNDYGKSKWEAEQLLTDWRNKEKSRSLLIVRPTVVFGKDNRGNVYNLLKQIASKPFIRIGKGNNHKSMAYVQNVADFLYFLLKHDPGSEIYNYADKPDMTMNELIHIINKVLKKKKMGNMGLPYFVGKLGGSLLDRVGSISGKTFAITNERIKKFCAESRFSSKKAFSSGFTPKFSLEEGLIQTIKHEFLPDSNDL